MLFILLMLLWATGAAAEEIAPPKRTPRPPTYPQQVLLREGKLLHDEGRYDEAIKKYQEILQENPDEATAIYEMALTYAAKKDYQKSLELSLKGAQYQTDFLPDYYNLIGNNYDLLGQSDKAIQVYKSGIKQFPQEAPLYFNLGVAYFRQGKSAEALKVLKQAVVVNPNHLSSHFALSQIYAREGYKIPALLAACRYLSAEAKSARAQATLNLVLSILASGVQSNKSEDKIQIFIDPAEKTDEGDFTAVTTALSIAAAAKYLKEEQPKSEIERSVTQFKILCEILGRVKTDKRPQGFVWDYYVPYFIELDQKGHVEAFTRFAFQTKYPTEAAAWESNNKDKMTQFINWANNYSWPKR